MATYSGKSPNKLKGLKGLPDEEDQIMEDTTTPMPEEEKQKGI